ncbi:hypothetical protein J7T55_005795 [Diaporthe amygdali]|uniref:uncharacterized protein n=1 Tax=Phomopsis amygdali TaxID=1214568 RepID=UPI0022FEEB47|nr:uncharacterized protein J7T55_005795 [Diaporthe amygdali]KAJ0124457.1 hypothetical protein J7T55_005795 [Diaporthe amygdali]
MNPVPRTTATLSRTQQTPSPSRSNELATGPRRPPPPRDRVRATSAHGWSRGRNEWVWTTTEGRRTRHITDTHMRESTWVGTAEISPTRDKPEIVERPRPRPPPPQGLEKRPR